MKILLDTQLALWWQTGHPRLRRETQTLIVSAETVLVSQVSIWEVAIQVSVGKLSVDIPGFVARVPEYGFGWLNISNSHILNVSQLPLFPDHKDPFDRLLIAQAQSESAVLLTADRRLARYGSVVRVV